MSTDKLYKMYIYKDKADLISIVEKHIKTTGIVNPVIYMKSEEAFSLRPYKVVRNKLPAKHVLITYITRQPKVEKCRCAQ